MRKSQSALEFVSLASVMLLVVVGFFAITSSKVIQSQEEGTKKVAEDIANIAYREIEIAKSTQDGYTRTFMMPETVNGVVYTINITDNRELTVNFSDYEYVKFLPANVTGNISRGLNKISKLDGIVYMNSFQVIIPQPLSVLLMKDSNNNAIRFDDEGNVILRRTFKPESSSAELTQTASDEFIFKDTNGGNIVRIDLNNGDMYIQGKLHESQSLLNPSGSDNFIIKDNNGAVVSYFDNNGDFFLKGTLTLNGNP